MREFRLIATVADPDLYSSGGRLHTYIYSPILGQNWARIGRYIGIKKISGGSNPQWTLASGEIWDPNKKHEKINPISTKLELQGEPLK